MSYFSIAVFRNGKKEFKENNLEPGAMKNELAKAQLEPLQSMVKLKNLGEHKPISWLVKQPEFEELYKKGMR